MITKGLRHIQIRENAVRESVNNEIVTSNTFKAKLGGIDNQQIFECFMCWIRNCWIKKTAYFYYSTKRVIEVDSLITKDAYNVRIA